MDSYPVEFELIMRSVVLNGISISIVYIYVCNDYPILKYNKAEILENISITQE